MEWNAYNKWQWVGHVARRTENRWPGRVMQWLCEAEKNYGYSQNLISRLKWEIGLFDLWQHNMRPNKLKSRRNRDRGWICWIMEAGRTGWHLENYMPATCYNLFLTIQFSCCIIIYRVTMHITRMVQSTGNCSADNRTTLLSVHKCVFYFWIVKEDHLNSEFEYLKLCHNANASQTHPLLPESIWNHAVSVCFWVWAIDKTFFVS